MPRYRITGALEASGADVDQMLDAANPAAAETIARARGILIESIKTADEPQPALSAAAAKPRYAVPDYAGLGFGSSLLIASSVLALLGAMVAGIAGIAELSSGNTDAGAPLLGYAVACFFYSALAAAIGSGLKALRDIAQNSFWNGSGIPYAAAASGPVRRDRL